MKELWLALDFGVAACILSGEKADDYVVARYQGQYERGISSLAERNFKFFLSGSVLWEKERTRCPNQILEVLENNGTIVTNLHEGECANCLAADACNHPCCHDWFFDIGHHMGLLYEEDKIGDNSVEKNGKQTRSESIFHFSQTDQIDDACDPLSYEGKSTGNIIYVFIYLFISIHSRTPRNSLTNTHTGHYSTPKIHCLDSASGEQLNVVSRLKQNSCSCSV